MSTSGQQVERLEKGQRRLTSEWIDRAAAALGVEPTDIITHTPRVEPDQPVIRNASEGDGAIAIKSVDLRYAMGDGTELSDYPEEEAVLYDPGFLRSITRAAPEHLFVARGDGDSMQPTLINDDTVLIDTTQRVLNMQDRIWACAYRGAGMIKRLRIIEAGQVEIRSDNKGIGDQVVDAGDLHIVGRVIWFGRRL